MKQPLFSTSYAPRDGESILDEIERDGMKKSESSQLFNLSRNTINLWCQRQAATGDFQAKKYRPPGNGHKITDWDKFRKFVSLNGDKTQAEMAALWKGEISARTISRALQKIGFTRKKRPMAIKSGTKKGGSSL